MRKLSRVGQDQNRLKPLLNPVKVCVTRDSQVIRWRSSMAEQLICNQQVDGSNPFASFVKSIGYEVSS